MLGKDFLISRKAVRSKRLTFENFTKEQDRARLILQAYSSMESAVSLILYVSSSLSRALVYDSFLHRDFRPHGPGMMELSSEPYLK